jgi:glutathione-regulated potassium-efflux system protein KefB
MEFLYSVVILLAAAIVAVPLARLLGLGSILGYLAAGLIVGPAGLRLVTDVENIQHISELGVVMLLFIIGLELRPGRLWTMRRSLLGLGLAQVAVTTAVLTALTHLAGIGWPASFIIGFALSLSSTAIVLPMLAERRLLATQAGRDSFAVLLFQDIAVIPAVALIPLLAEGDFSTMSGTNILLAIARAAVALMVVLIGGRFVIRPLFRLVDMSKAPEIFTATALVVVIGTALLVSEAGLSMSLGAFMAGVLLSDSEYRHQVRADIEPFEGLLLGVFFTSVGMSANLGIFLAQPFFLLAAVAALLVVKGTICFFISRLSGSDTQHAVRFAIALPQAGEFAFVIFAIAVANGVLPEELAQMATVIVTLSMLLAPLLFALQERFIAPLFAQPAPPFDDVTGENPVLICGFGRIGQIVGRVLRMRGLPFTALDKSAEQVALVRRFGTPVYYGDTTRLDLLRAAGAEQAKVIVIAVSDIEESVTVAELCARHFPQASVLARVRNRRHAHLLMDRGVKHIIRETFYSSLRLSEEVLLELGVGAREARRTTEIFAERDEQMLREQHDYYDDEKQLIQTTRQISEELQRLLEADQAATTQWAAVHD